MAENLNLVITLFSTLCAALVLGWVMHRLRLSPILGYLLAGIVVGPHTPGFNADREIAHSLADVGVILLMFGVGLNFHFRQLLSVWRIALPGAVVQSGITTLVAAGIARLLGWNLATGVIFGLSLSVASTVVLSRVLAESGELATRQGRVVVGWLVVEDLLTVAVLVLIPALLSRAETPVASVALALLKIGLLMVFTLLVGGKVIPRVLKAVAETRSQELFTLTILVLALGIAVGSAELFGVSIALGAFLAGMVVGRSEFSLRAATEALPLRDAFAVLFFVSIGMLLDPGKILDHPASLAVALGCILLCKPIAAFAIALVLRHPLRVTVTAALALAQIGEFSFILAALAERLGLVDGSMVDCIITASIVSIAVNPLLFRFRAPLETWLSGNRLLFRWISSRAAKPSSSEESALSGSPGHAVIVGYGPVGRTVADLLTRNGVSVTVIEMNLDTVHALRKRGIPAIYGDASHRPVIEATGIERAASFIVTAPGREAAEAIRLVRESGGAVRILARAAYVQEKSALRKAGADHVFTGEEEVALAMADYVLRDLGATPEQIEGERERLRATTVEETAGRN
jgi:CPA2 family monovalent cation:H+ antiporter-2